MQDHQDRIAALMEQLIETGPDGMAQAFTALFNLAMRLEREQHLGAGLHERAEGRRGYVERLQAAIVSDLLCTRLPVHAERKG